MKHVQTDLLIIGSGIAALQTARLISNHFSVAIITKDRIRTSSSYRAQGGIAAVTSRADSFEEHIEDTLQAGEHHHYLPHVTALVQDGASAMQQLLEEGLPIDRQDNGEPLLGLEGAHGKHRIVHAGGDQTGKYLVEHLLQQLPPNVTIYEHEMAYELLLNHEGHCIGAKTVHDGEHTSFFAHDTILATGGAAALYNCTSNFETNTGDGIALAWRAGAKIADMEFMQFHPSLLYVNGKGCGLVSEAVRGQGGKFVDEHSESIMANIHPLGDLAPRHITAHTLHQKQQAGEQTFLQIDTIDHFAEKFPTIATLCTANGVQLANGRIPVAPGSHFLMGGIVANSHGETSIPHLFAVGEVACTAVHGANRLASNSLLECIAFGHRLADYINTHGRSQQNFVVRPAEQQNKAITTFSRHELQTHMTNSLGIIRDQQTMEAFLQSLPSFEDLLTVRLDHMPTDRIERILMHAVARMMTTAALTRTESRGAHIRTDFPQMERQWGEKWILFEKNNMNVRKHKDEYNQVRQHAEAVL